MNVPFSMRKHSTRMLGLGIQIIPPGQVQPYIIIDCSLKHELLTVNVLVRANYCIVSLVHIHSIRIVQFIAAHSKAPFRLTPLFMYQFYRSTLKR